MPLFQYVNIKQYRFGLRQTLKPAVDNVTLSVTKHQTTLHGHVFTYAPKFLYCWVTDLISKQILQILLFLFYVLISCDCVTEYPVTIIMMYVDYGLHTVHGLIFYLYFSHKMFNLLLFIDDVHSIYPNTTDVTWGKIISNVYICVTIVYVSTYLCRLEQVWTC